MECVQLHRAPSLLEGYRSTAARRKLEGPWLLGTGPSQRLEWNGEYVAPLFPDKKYYQVPKLHTTTRTAQMPKQPNKGHRQTVDPTQNSKRKMPSDYLLAFSISI